jgi:hypothetical protein
MKKYTILFFCFLFFNTYCQSSDTIYFLINRKDSLIKKQIATKLNSYEGYIIYYSKKTVIKKNKTPIIEGEVWVADEKYDYNVNGQKNVSFKFLRKNDRIIEKEQLNEFKTVKNREEFLDFGRSKGFDLLGITYLFIEPTDDDDKFILRKVYPVVFE